MSEPIPSQKTAHGLLAHAHRYGPPEKVEAAKATFLAAQLKRRILAAIAAETPPTDAHRAELAALLTDGGRR
ncbi:MAG: hypothetical protein ACTHNS_16270 [Marmoricola sp.]